MDRMNISKFTPGRTRHLLAAISVACLVTASQAAELLPAEAEAAWAVIRATDKAPVPAAEWLENAPTKESVAKFDQDSAVASLELAAMCEEFAKKFPDDERASRANFRALIAMKLAGKLGNNTAQDRFEALKQTLSPLPAEVDFVLDAAYAMHLSELLDYEVNGVDLGVYSKEIQFLIKHHPEQYDTGRMQFQLAQSLVSAGQLEQGKSTLQNIIDSKADEEFIVAARALLSQAKRVGKPLALEFTDLKGNKVSIKDYHGRVVLVDFWAMWCGPCLRSLPKLKSLHNRLGTENFEILGINFDGNSEALAKFIKEETMAWPQYPGGEPGENKLGETFGIHQWPTVWLIDKQGVLRDIAGETETEMKIVKLLNEKL